jgi:hypothetical protein
MGIIYKSKTEWCLLFDWDVRFEMLKTEGTVFGNCPGEMR